MAGFLPDTSCMVAAVCSWHVHHSRAAAAIQRRLDSQERLIVAAPALVEAYSVLTRLPAPHRLSPEDAATLLDANFVGSARVVSLAARSYSALLRSAPAEKVSGGRIYDAVIARCAVDARATTLLTFNEDHFAAFASQRLAIVVP